MTTMQNSLYNYQSGFPNNHSNDFCLSFLNDEIYKGFNQGLRTDMSLIVVQKEFNEIDQDFLLKNCMI